MPRWLTMLLLLLLVAPALAAKGDEAPAEDVDYLELATVLVRDGNYERAAGVLEQVDTEDKKLDRARYHLVRGLVHLNLSLFSQAAIDFGEAIELQEKQAAEDKDVQFDKIWYVYLGQAHFYSDAFEEALAAFEKAGARGEEIPSTFPLRAEAYRKLERFPEAWDVLGQGMKVHPKYHELLRRKVFIAIELQLYQAAAQLGRLYLERTDAKAEDYLAIGVALNRSGGQADAIKFLELARLRFPQSHAVASELARLYKDRGQYRTAAVMLERASLDGSDDLAVDAAELYRQAGELFRALALNARVADSKMRLRQRLGILLELRRYELVAIMDRDLRRVGLLQDEGLRYALAYALFKTGDYDRSDQLLSGIRDPGIFRQATELRKAMSDCREERWRC